MSTTEYPVNGPREPVYALMRGLGFSMSNWTDKIWHSADGIQVSIFGAGSMARISVRDKPRGECELDQLGARLDAIRLDGVSGQDRDSYSDTQDRDSYTVD